MRGYCNGWPTTHPGSNWPTGGCGADFPRNIASVAGLSSLGAPVPPPPKSPPRRQCTELELEARNFTQPSSTSWLVDRSVVSGLTNELPENGSRKNVPTDASFDVTASITACWRAAAREVGLRRVEHVLADARVDQRALAVHVLVSLLEPPAGPLVAPRLRRVRAVEPIRPDRLRHVHVDPAERVDQILEVAEVDDDHVVHVEARELVDRAEGELGTTDLERRVDLLRAVARDRHLEIARDREVVEAVVRRVGPEQHDRVGVHVARARGERGVVGAEHQHGRRVRSQEAALRRECRLRIRREPAVRVGDSALDREPAGDGPDDQEKHERAKGGSDPKSPARALRRRGAGTAIVGDGALAILRAPHTRGPHGWNLALRATAAVHAIGLLFPRHPAG